MSIRFCRNWQSNPFIGTLGKQPLGTITGQNTRVIKAFFTEGDILKLSEICMWHVTASHVATFSVCSCGEKCRRHLKTFRFIIDPILLLLMFVNCLFKALCFDMIILNLFCTIVVNLKCSCCICTAFNLHTTQFIGEGIWTTLDCCCRCGKMSVYHVAFDAGKSVPHHSSLSLTFNICDQGEN